MRELHPTVSAATPFATRGFLMTADPDRTLRMTRRFEALPERVFDAWLKPKLARKWFFASQADELFTTQIDARDGGRWAITARRDGADYTASGEYLEIERPHRLVFTIAMLQFSPNSDRITIETASSGAG